MRLIRNSGENRKFQMLVAGETWLAAGLSTVPGAVFGSPDNSATFEALVVERDALSLVSDDQIKGNDSIILVDPTDRERWRVTALKAGRPSARITSLSSAAAAGAAEHAMLLSLSLTRKLFSSYSAVVDGSWSHPSSGPTLVRKTIGIVGLGRSGRELAVRAARFGMRVVYSDIVAKEQLEAQLGVERLSFDQLLREADVVSLHLSATVETFRLIDAPELASMKRTAILINVADGRLIDEGALIKALRNGDIAGAGLDSFAYQPLATDSPLIGFENVVLTPNTAWMSIEQERSLWLAEINRVLETTLGAARATD